MTEPGDRNRLECSCGLVVVSDDPETLLRIVETHDCPKTYADRENKSGDRWWHGLFSLEGALIIFLICNLLWSYFGRGK